MTNVKTAKDALINLVTTWGTEPEFDENDVAEFWLVDMIKQFFSENDCVSFFSKWTGIVESITREICFFYEVSLLGGSKLD